MDNYIFIDVKNVIYNIDVNVRKYFGYIIYVIRINIYMMYYKQVCCKKVFFIFYFEIDICFLINILIEVMLFYDDIFF